MLTNIYIYIDDLQLIIFVIKPVSFISTSTSSFFKTRGRVNLRLIQCITIFYRKRKVFND